LTFKTVLIDKQFSGISGKETVRTAYFSWWAILLRLQRQIAERLINNGKKVKLSM
jgi:hypothetical protein